MADVVEKIIAELLHDLLENRDAKFKVANTSSWNNFHVDNDQILRLGCDSIGLTKRKIAYRKRNSRYRFATVLYVLATVHRFLLEGVTCSYRELYYKNIPLVRSQRNLNCAVRDVCILLESYPWDLGILASSKGLITGALRIFMVNGDLIDCRHHGGVTILPHDMTSVDHLETNALFVLLVEKDTVFKKLLAVDIFNMIGVEIILITGKGYPDISTRQIVRRLSRECALPIYALVDADPFGVEIMLVYRHGSKQLAHSAEALACPEIKWIGIHPSEILMMGLPTIPLSQRDYKKIGDLQGRDYINCSVRGELEVLRCLERKAEIEGLQINFLLQDYIPNKIRRNLLL